MTSSADVGVGRVGLAVEDADAVADFYADVAGLDRRSTDRGAVLTAGGDPLLAVRSAPEDPQRPASAAGLFHLALRYPTRQALAATLGRIRDRWTLSGASDHLVSEALYLSDPEANGVECYWDRPRAEWERTPDGGVRMDTLALDLEDLAAADENAPDAAPPGTDVGHVHLEVTDLARSRAFYVDALGFDEMTRMGGALFVGAGGYHHHVGLNVWNGRSEPSSGRGLDWFEVRFPGRESLAAAADRVADAGYDVERTDDGAVATDPDGIAVRLTA